MHLQNIPKGAEKMAEEMKQTTVRIPSELHKQFKILCTQQDAIMNDVIVGLITEYIERAQAEQKEGTQKV
jgi:predicted HicB family RNase H-like nuclease